MRVYVTDVKLYTQIQYDANETDWFEKYEDIMSANNDAAYLLIESFKGGKDFVYDKELDAYKCTLESYKKWSSFCKRQKRLDDKTESLHINQGYIDFASAEIDYSSAENYHETLERFLDTLRNK